MPDNQIPNNPTEQPFTRRTIENPSASANAVIPPVISTPVEPISARALPDVQHGGFKDFFSTNKYYFLAIFAGVLIISVLAYFAFKKVPQAPLTEANVAISVEVPSQVASGGEAIYKITVQNNDAQKLVSLELELAYPDGVNFQSSQPAPENSSGSLFPVPDLISGQNAVVFVKAKVSGNVSDQKTLNIKLHYKYANFNSEFVKQQSSTISLAASNVLVELSGPTTTNNAQLVIYNVKYQNDSDNDLKSARIKMSYPDGFVFASANPPASLGTDTWDIGALAKAAEGNIQIQGTFSAISPGESKTATAQFLILGNDGQFFTQNSSSFTTAIASLPLLVSQDLTPQNPGGIIDPGDDLNFTIRYQNNASIVANGVNVVVVLDSKVVDLSSIRAEGGQVNNNSITWNAASVPQLERLAPNDSGQLTFNFHVNNPATKDSSKNLTIVSNVKIKSNEYDSFFPGAPLSLKLSSPASIARTLTFATGQLPPQVGRSTTYKVRFSLSNSGNDFNNGVLTAFIPLGAGSFNKSGVTPAESNNTQFDPSTGKLTWNVGNLAAYAGRFGAPKVLEFQITFNPSSGQANKTPVLVNTISFTAKDLFTAQDVNLKADDINTNSLSGSNGFSNGTVQP